VRPRLCAGRGHPRLPMVPRHTKKPTGDQTAHEHRNQVPIQARAGKRRNARVVRDDQLHLRAPSSASRVSKSTTRRVPRRDRRDRRRSPCVVRRLASGRATSAPARRPLGRAAQFGRTSSSSSAGRAVEARLRATTGATDAATSPPNASTSTAANRQPAEGNQRASPTGRRTARR